MGTVGAWQLAGLDIGGGEDRAARQPLRAGALRLQGWLAVAVTAGMIVIALATAVWWAAVAVKAPAALTGSPAGSGSAAVPQLIVAMVVMLAACAVAGRGARRVARALPDLQAS